MAKRKRKVSLFEAIGGDSGRLLQMPSWLQPGESGSAPTATERPATALKQPPGLDTPIAAKSTREAGEPMIAVVDSRLRLTLGYVSCLVICIGLIVLLAGAYKLGKGPAAATVTGGGDASNALGGRTSAADADAYVFKAAQDEAEGLLPQSGPVLVVQDNVASLENAKAIQRYLRTMGYTPFVHVDGARIAILDTVKVGEMSEADLKDYRQRLADLGKDVQWKLRAQYGFHKAQVVLIAPQ